MMLKERVKRETGFELLRIIAMFLIGAVHVMNYGGMLSNALPQTIKWQKLIYSVFTISVNVFVLISGYFMINSKLKPKKLLFLWLQVLAYSVGSYIVSCLCFKTKFSLYQFAQRWLPVIFNKYWFFTAYFLLVLISPFLNKILHNSTKKELTFLVCVLLLVVICCNTFPIKSVVSLSAGYSLIWFCFLYIFAGFLRLYPLNIKKWLVFIIYFVSTLALWIFACIPKNNIILKIIYNPMEYTSPLVLIASISIFLLFKGINVKNTFIHNSICWISSLTFGIYLFQESAIKHPLYFKILKVQSFYSSKFSPFAVLLIALEIFLLGLACEVIRKLLLLCIKPIINKFENRFNKNKTPPLDTTSQPIPSIDNNNQSTTNTP